jgi:UDP-2,3-diacylglucosamine hydrolase
MTENRTLFVSDLHLDAAAPAAITQFQLFLQEQVRNASALYILGDLFETWVGDDDDEPARDSVCNALRGLTAAGTACYVMRGNRDFLYGATFEQRTGCVLLPDPVRTAIGGRTVMLTHGDLLCTGDHGYQSFRTLVRDPDFQRRYLDLPLSTRRAIAQSARQRSQRYTRHMAEDIMDVDAATVATALSVGNCDLLIHGHTHRPGVHRLNIGGRAASRVVLGDWYEQGSCLEIYADGRYELLALPRAA